MTKTEKPRNPRAAKPGTSVATKATERTALMSQTALDLFAQDAATYAPTFSTEDRAINFLRIAQAMTPQAKKLDPQYIPGVEEGVFFTSITRRALPTVTFIPCYWTKNYTWWKPRNAGGGLVKNFAKDKDASRVMAAERNPDTGRLELRNVMPGVAVVEVVEADLYFGLIVLPDGSSEEAVLSLSSTQLPKARKWNSVIHSLKHPKTGAPLPLFARAYTLATVGEQNERGSWAGLVVEPGPMLPDLAERWDVLYSACKALADDCLRGVKVEVVDAEVVSVTSAQETLEEEDYEVANGDGDEDVAL